jgi:hypothetical protein
MRLILLIFTVPMLSSCTWLSDWGEGSARGTDPHVTTYQDAMAAFSDCASTSDMAVRANAAARLATAETMMAAETRPTDPDHFYRLDRVSAARQFCADAVR